MIPVSELASPRVQAASSNGFSLQFYSCHPFIPAKRSAVPTSTAKRRCPSRSYARQPPVLCIVGCTLVNLPFPSLNKSSSNSSIQGRAKTGLRWRNPSDFSPSHDRASIVSVSAVRAAAASFPDDASSEESPQQSQRGQNSRVLSSFSEVLEKRTGMDAESSEEETTGALQKTTKVLQPDGEPQTVVEEYKLTDEGTLTTVKVTRGENTQRTNTKVSRLVAEVGIQAESLHNKMRNFSVRNFIKDWGKKEPGLEDLKFNAAMYEPVEGVSNIAQWTATELTLQRAQMIRISRDALYLILAFSLFGCVRILEAVAAVFATNPANFWKLTEAMNAMDPLTVASLAHGLRQPIIGMLEVDPTNLEEVCRLKSKFWAELHKFYERQWKVIATLGVARFLTLLVKQLPAAEWFTQKFKVLWDISMALPIF